MKPVYIMLTEMQRKWLAQTLATMSMDNNFDSEMKERVLFALASDIIMPSNINLMKHARDNIRWKLLQTRHKYAAALHDVDYNGMQKYGEQQIELEHELDFVREFLHMARSDNHDE